MVLTLMPLSATILPFTTRPLSIIKFGPATLRELHYNDKLINFSAVRAKVKAKSISSQVPICIYIPRTLEKNPQVVLRIPNAFNWKMNGWVVDEFFKAVYRIVPGRVEKNGSMIVDLCEIVKNGTSADQIIHDMGYWFPKVTFRKTLHIPRLREILDKIREELIMKIRAATD